MRTSLHLSPYPIKSGANPLSGNYNKFQTLQSGEHQAIIMANDHRAYHLGEELIGYLSAMAKVAGRRLGDIEYFVVQVKTPFTGVIEPVGRVIDPGKVRWLLCSHDQPHISRVLRTGHPRSEIEVIPTRVGCGLAMSERHGQLIHNWLEAGTLELSNSVTTSRR